jgi:uncharacterized protein YjhX (UPF0386 family)
MNLKAAKKLRKLVHLLQEKGTIESKAWVEYGVRNRTLTRVARDKEGHLKEVRVPDQTVWLLPSCGRGVYQQMKRQAKRERRFGR